MRLHVAQHKGFFIIIEHQVLPHDQLMPADFAYAHQKGHRASAARQSRGFGIQKQKRLGGQAFGQLRVQLHKRKNPCRQRQAARQGKAGFTDQAILRARLGGRLRLPGLRLDGTKLISQRTHGYLPSIWL